jgi:hypothetical protein
MKGGRFDTLKSDSTHHFFRNACTKPGSLRFSQFSGCWLILSVYILMSFDFPFVRLFEFGNFVITLIHWVSTNKQKMQWKSIPGADPGFVVRGGAWVGEGSGDRLRSPAGPRQSPDRGPGGRSPPEALGFEELQTFIWTTILNQPHLFYQTKKTWFWVLILSDNC